MIVLPELRNSSGISLEEARLEKRSVRNYKDEVLTLAEISQLLSAQGITHPGGYRTAPSAVALYPLSMWLQGMWMVSGQESISTARMGMK